MAKCLSLSAVHRISQLNTHNLLVFPIRIHISAGWKWLFTFFFAFIRGDSLAPCQGFCLPESSFKFLMKLYLEGFGAKERSMNDIWNGSRKSFSSSVHGLTQWMQTMAMAALALEQRQLNTARYGTWCQLNVRHSTSNLSISTVVGARVSGRRENYFSNNGRANANDIFDISSRTRLTRYHNSFCFSVSRHVLKLWGPERQEPGSSVLHRLLPSTLPRSLLMSNVK
jgi:hypothetical protein